MNRRAFFGVLAAGIAAAVDPERLLWVPGRKLISIPKPTVARGDLEELARAMDEFAARYIEPAVMELVAQMDAAFIEGQTWPIAQPGYLDRLQSRGYTAPVRFR